ncbi:MAG: phospholipid transport system substrate-binding protein [Phenylobacterium sp.]|jgi:phospholipid transport system substrate-binding protein
MTMTKSITQLFALTFFVLFASVATAVTAEQAKGPALTTSINPYHMIQQVADSAFKRISTDQAKIQQDPNHLKVIVSEELMPYIDHRYAARVVLYKIKASKADKKAFYQAFEQYLITTYATVFAQYTNQKVIFDPAKNFDGKKMVMVKSHIINPDSADTDIEFKVRKNKKTGVWKAYDLRAMGISLLDSKKAELKSLLRKKGGVNNVAQLLMKKAQADIVMDKKV